MRLFLLRDGDRPVTTLFLSENILPQTAEPMLVEPVSEWTAMNMIKSGGIKLISFFPEGDTAIPLELAAAVRFQGECMLKVKSPSLADDRVLFLGKVLKELAGVTAVRADVNLGGYNFRRLHEEGKTL
jgi:hypothetical protein